jgi:hypothetical protein
MTDFLSALKADLLDRRLAPLLALAAVALAAACAYAVLGGGSSASKPTVSPAVSAANAVAPPAGLAVTQATPEKAVAEVTSGAAAQRRGGSRDPFTPLPEAKAAATTTSAASPSAGAGSSSGSSSSSSGEGAKSESTGSSNQKSGGSSPQKPAKPKTVYHVAVLFGVLPAGVTPEGASLTPYESLKLLSPLPSAQQPLLVFRGVTAGGKSATFTLVSEAILHGGAACLPSASQCQAIDLKPGQSEQLEYISPAGEVSVYELRIVSIVSTKASTGSVKGVLRGESKAGRELLRRAGLTAIPFLHASSTAGVLVFSQHGALTARAHTAAQPRRRP